MKNFNNEPFLKTLFRYALGISLGSILTTAAANSHTEPTVNNKNKPIENTAVMHLKPKLCIRGTSSEQCSLEVNIIWKGNNIGKYCLYSEQSLQPLRCWIQHSQGHIEDRISITKDLDYWLTWQVNNKELARKTLKVLTAKSNDRRRSRRRRHVWSVF